MNYRFKPIVTVTLDETFDVSTFGDVKYPIPDKNKIWEFVDSKNMPRINLSQNPSAIEILQYVKNMRRFAFSKDRESLILMLNSSLQGPTEKAWANDAGFDFDKIERRLLNWMWQTRSWNQTMFDSREGKKFDESASAHIDIFKLVAKNMGLRAEDELTKRYFAKSVGMNIAQIFDENGTLVEFQRLVQMAEQSASVQSSPAHQEETVAAATIRPGYNGKQSLIPQQQKNGKTFYKRAKPPKPFQSQYRGKKFPDTRESPKSVQCQLCNGSGHTARDCPYQKPKIQKQHAKHPKGENAVARLFALGDGRRTDSFMYHARTVKTLLMPC